MERKSFTYKLLDGAEYIFQERNMEDVDLSHLQNKIRAERVKFIQENIKAEDLQLPLLMSEMKNSYTGEDIGEYISSHKEEQVLLVFHSFKLGSQKTFEEFQKLVNDDIVKRLRTLLNELESSESISEDDIAKALGVPLKKVQQWRNEQPQVYQAMKKSVKKNMIKESQKK